MRTLADWIAAGMPDHFDGWDMTETKQWLAYLGDGPLHLVGEPGYARLELIVKGETYGALLHGQPGEYQFPCCPSPTCRSLIACRQDFPGGQARCPCHGCVVDVFRDGDGTIRLETSTRPWVPAPDEVPAVHAPPKRRKPRKKNKAPWMPKEEAPTPKKTRRKA